MQVLLTRDIRKLGHVGDVVEVRPGFARNYLYPQRLAIEPTDENLRAIEREKVRAAAERARKLEEYKGLAEKMTDVTVTIEALANPEGTLYGSVGAKEIAAALQALGHPIRAEWVMLDRPIRTVDKRNVRIEFTDDLSVEVKLWVVRQGGSTDAGQPESEHAEPDQPAGDEQPAEDDE
jgi:large subunit ribosomal protein L9